MTFMSSYVHVSDGARGLSMKADVVRRRLMADVHAKDEWGQAVRYAPSGRPVLLVRNLSGNVKHFTWVTWAE